MDIKTKEMLTEYFNTLNNSIKKIFDYKSKYTDLSLDNKKILDEFENATSLLLDKIKFYLDNPNDWRKYNFQYQNYIYKKYEKICEHLKHHFGRDYNLSNDNFCVDFFTRTRRVIEQYNLELINVFDHFKYGDSNYVLFGKNGAGKTTLLNKLSLDIMGDYSIVSKASRQVDYDRNKYISESAISLNGALSDDNNTMFILSKCIVNNEIKQHREKINDDLIINKRMINIFDSLGLDRKLIIEPNGELKLYFDQTPEYNVSSASDGEKTILYFIMVTLLSPENSYVFIDEPENHLNGELMKKLFDILEKERKDLKFVYATHNISFIESRKNVRLVYLEKTDKYNHWKFKDIESFEEIPLEVILNVEGTSDSIIFCEGENDKSIDKKLYSVLFPNYQVSKANGCAKVIIQTELFNKNRRIFRREAYGIVDNDFRDNSEIDKLISKNVCVLSFNEIENVLLFDMCLENVINYVKCQKSLSDIKEDIIGYILLNIQDVKNDYASKLYRKINIKCRFNGTLKIEEELKKNNEKNTLEFLGQYKLFEQNLENYVKNNNYTELMKLVPGKMLLSFAAKQIGVNVDNYIDILLDIISKDNDLRVKIIDVLFVKKVFD